MFLFDFIKLPELFARMAAPPEVALTPSEVIYCENKLKVLHYLPMVKLTSSVPILIVNSLINKYYILDLRPGRSYVEYLVKLGFNVYMLDWGVPEHSDRNVTLNDHINYYLKNSVLAVLEHAQAKQISMIGYCMGGTMSLIYAALHRKYLKNLILLATPIDFHNDSLLSCWGKQEYLDVDKLIDACGNVPVEVLRNIFMMLKPTKNFTKYLDLMEHINDAEYVKTFLAFDYWVNDAVPVPGETFREFIKATYQDNLLKQSRLRLARHTVKLSQINCAILNIVAEQDDIVPPVSSIILMDLIGSKDKELLQVKGGHHGLSIGMSAMQIVWPKSVEWLRQRSH